MTQNTGETVNFEVGDRNRLMLILGESHSSPLAALREFIQNARDAVVEADLRDEEPLVRVHLEKRREAPGQVRISDPGIGIPRSKMRRIPAELCSSEKLQKVELEGRFGVGLLSYVSLAERCKIVSRSRAEGETLSLTLPTRSELKEGTSSPKGHIRREDDRPYPGTDVYLVDLHDEVLDYLQPSRVRRYLARHYGSQIREHQLKIDLVGREGERTPVKPVEYKGELFRRSVRTKFGKVEVELYLNARSGDRSVQLVAGEAKTVIGSIERTVDVLNRAPWNEGRMEGEIRCPYLEPVPTRDGVKPHSEKFPAFLEAVGGLENELEEQLARLSARRQEEERQRVLTRIHEAFRQLAKEQEREHKFYQAVADSEGEERPGKVTKEREPGGSEQAGGDDEGATVPRVDPSKARKARQRLQEGLGLHFEEWKPREERSRVEDDRIYINELNPDYRRVESDPSLFGSYVLTCAMREEAVREHGGISPDTLEEYVDLLVNMERILDMGIEPK